MNDLRNRPTYPLRSTLLLVALAAMLLLAAAAHAQQTGQVSNPPPVPPYAQAQPASCGAGENKLHYSLTPYLWLPSITGDVEARGVDASVNISALDVIRKLNWATMLHIEAQRDRWGFYVDPLYVKLSAGGSVGPIPASVHFRQWLVEFAATYKLMGSDQAVSGRSSSLRALVGGRFWSMGTGIDVRNNVSVSRTREWVDPIIGLRYTLSGKPWSFVLQGDIGGFGAASESTWSIAPILTYRLSDSGSLVVGYRALGVDDTQGSGNDLSKLDVNYHGPILGYAISF